MAFNLYISKIKMKPGCLYSEKLTDIQEFYSDGMRCTPPGWYSVEVVWTHLLKSPWKPIHLNVYPYPYLIPAKTADGVIYIRSTVENSMRDHIFDLPREEA